MKNKKVVNVKLYFTSIILFSITACSQDADRQIYEESGFDQQVYEESTKNNNDEYITLDNGDVVKAHPDEENFIDIDETVVEATVDVNEFSRDSGAFGDVEYLPEFQVHILSRLDPGQYYAQEIIPQARYLEPKYITDMTIVSKNNQPIQVYNVIVNRGHSCSITSGNRSGTLSFGQYIKSNISGCTQFQIVEVLIETDMGDAIYTFGS